MRAHLLQRGRAELDGDVVELLVPLGAEVAHDVGVLVRLAEQLHLPVHQVETLRQEALHGHAAAIEVSPVCTPPVMAVPTTTRHCRAQRCRGTAQTGSGRCQARPSAPSAQEQCPEPRAGRNLCSEQGTRGSGDRCCRKTTSLAFYCGWPGGRHCWQSHGNFLGRFDKGWLRGRQQRSHKHLCTAQMPGGEGACHRAVLVAPRQQWRLSRHPRCHPPEDKGSSSSVAQHILGVKRNFPNYDHVWFRICKDRQPSTYKRQSVLYEGHAVQ